MAGVLNATTPLRSLLIGLALGAERSFHRVRLGGLLLGFAGTLLIFAPWQQGGLTGWGALTLLGAALSYAVAFAFACMGRKLTGRGTTPMALSAAQLVTATGLSTLALPAGDLESANVNATGLTAVVILGIFGTGVTFTLHYRLIADEGATSAATVGHLLPVVSVALGAIVLNEEITFRIVAGMVVVLAGVGMTQRPKRTPAPLVTVDMDWRGRKRSPSAGPRRDGVTEQRLRRIGRVRGLPCPFEAAPRRTHACRRCTEPLVCAGHDFAPPPRRDIRRWSVVAAALREGAAPRRPVRLRPRHGAELPPPYTLRAAGLQMRGRAHGDSARRDAVPRRSSPSPATATRRRPKRTEKSGPTRQLTDQTVHATMLRHSPTRG